MLMVNQMNGFGGGGAGQLNVRPAITDSTNLGTSGLVAFAKISANRILVFQNTTTTHKISLYEIAFDGSHTLISEVTGSADEFVHVSDEIRPLSSGKFLFLTMGIDGAIVYQYFGYLVSVTGDTITISNRTAMASLLAGYNDDAPHTPIFLAEPDDNDVVGVAYRGYNGTAYRFITCAGGNSISAASATVNPFSFGNFIAPFIIRRGDDYVLLANYYNDIGDYFAVIDNTGSVLKTATAVGAGPGGSGGVSLNGINCEDRILFGGGKYWGTLTGSGSSWTVDHVTAHQFGSTSFMPCCHFKHNGMLYKMTAFNTGGNRWHFIQPYSEIAGAIAIFGAEYLFSEGSFTGGPVGFVSMNEKQLAGIQVYSGEACLLRTLM